MVAGVAATQNKKTSHKGESVKMGFKNWFKICKLYLFGFIGCMWCELHHTCNVTKVILTQNIFFLPKLKQVLFLPKLKETVTLGHVMKTVKVKWQKLTGLCPAHTTHKMQI